MPSFDVATVGDNCIDLYMPPIARSTVGGNAVNVAVHLARGGVRVGYFGAVADDAAGRRTTALLAENKVDVGHVVIRQGNTAVSHLDVDQSGDRIITFEDFGVCAGYRPAADEVALLKAMRHVHLGWLDDGGALKRSLAESGVSVSQDLAVNPGADGLAIAFASAGASDDLARRLLGEALAQGARLAVVTRGPRGSMASDGRNLFECGIAPTDVLDTTGAGDTFIGAFIAAHLRGADVPACLQAGRDAAAATCRHLGGFPQTPAIERELAACRASERA